MFKFILALTAIASGFSAAADGFVCESYAGNLRIKVYDSGNGVRGRAIMIVSAPDRDDHRTLAALPVENLQTTAAGVSYSGKVVKRDNGPTYIAPSLAGVEMTNVNEIILQVNHDMSQPLTDAAEVPGEMTLVLRSGAPDIHMEALCDRYIKGEVSLRR